MSIASCETEQKFEFLIRVLEAGSLCGFTLGVGGTGGAGGATLEVFVWGATLGGISGKSRLGSVCSKFSSWGSIGMGGDRNGQVCVEILLSLVFLVVNFGEWRCGGISIWGVATASENILLRRFCSLWWDSWRRWGRWPLIAVMRFPAAAMMASAGVAVGFDRYLCL